MSTRPDIWRGRRVLVTGHTGFKGSWLSLWLEQLGAEVGGYALAPPTEPSLFDMARVGSGVASVIGDVADEKHLVKTLEDQQPEVVFHLAAQPIVRDSYREPVETFRTNVLGTAHLLEAVRTVGSTRVVVVVTSDKSYRNHGWDRGYRETDELGGSDPYSASKAAAELVTESYRRSFFTSAPDEAPDEASDVPTAVASARGGNVIGGGDWSADRLVPDAARAVLAKSDLVVRNPSSIRPWQHVLDCLAGYLTLGARLWDDPALAGPWNFGPDDDDVRDVAWIADRLVDLWDGRLAWHAEIDPNAPHEAATLRLDSSRARESLEWQPRLRIDDTLAWTVAWHRRSLEEDPRDVSLSQLAEYTGLDS